jgi:hypothetical protein
MEVNHLLIVAKVDDLPKYLQDSAKSLRLPLNNNGLGQCQRNCSVLNIFEVAHYDNLQSKLDKHIVKSGD